MKTMLLKNTHVRVLEHQRDPHITVVNFETTSESGPTEVDESSSRVLKHKSPSSSWEFPQLVVRDQSMINDSDARNYPWYGSKNQLAAMDCRKSEILVIHTVRWSMTIDIDVKPDER
ncbi:unnamed protein product [Didymodactylos carnosus]|uniref:Uncharacterized protein n=1 Tax=Didymodactylos carnosus TaxID=1234261 RepID=A0A8S2K2U5_9BILA|nr:unnamed protein product [Didymodactylos carnosus]CAF3826207.1 unnamed protein product [Didymodactylos carnosus]